jgi:hypothetical protein
MIAVPVCSRRCRIGSKRKPDRRRERGRLLVRDQEPALTRRHRDHHALGHPARHLVREGLDPALRVRDADHLQHLEGALAGRAVLHAAMELEDLGDLAADVLDRVQRRLGLLEDHADPVAPELPEVVRLELQQVLPVEQDLAARRGRWVTSP